MDTTVTDQCNEDIRDGLSGLHLLPGELINKPDRLTDDTPYSTSSNTLLSEQTHDLVLQDDYVNTTHRRGKPIINKIDKKVTNTLYST